jgi:RND superfamily putative drug exporter
MIGLGVGLTILVDASLIRCILIPAAMSLMGSYNWYAPKRVKDFIDRLGLKDY